MSWFDFDWVDAFSHRDFGGNGCAVVHGGAGLPTRTCMDFLRETSLVECTPSEPMAAYLWHHGLMKKDSFVAEQGHWLGRPGQARVSRIGTADAMTDEKLAGDGFVLMRGEVDLPASP